MRTNASKFLVVVAAFTFCNSRLHAQCIAAGPNNPESTANNNAIGSISWANTANVISSNNSRSTASALILGNTSNYLVATNFNFSLPSTAVVCGITVEMEKSASGLFQNVTDQSVRIVKAGAVSGSEHALAGTWPTSDTYASYGSSSDLWGLTWTYADVNNAGFGVAIAARLNGLAILPSARIDHIRINVYYVDTLPIELLSCSANIENGRTVVINWQTKSETNNDFFSVERSQDAKTWIKIGHVDGSGNSSNINHYEFTDKAAHLGINYYRLSQTDFNGDTENLEMLTVLVQPEKAAVFPNPSKGSAQLSSTYPIGAISIMNEFGKEIWNEEFFCDDQIRLTEIPDLGTGYFLIRVSDCSGNVLIVKYLQISD